MIYPELLAELIEYFKKLPGIGEKTAERLALSLLDANQEDLEIFSESIKNLKSTIKRCTVCNNLSDSDVCEICKDKTRNHNTLCVVEECKNVILIEKNNIFDGYYHVLDGLISPIDGINPEDINIDMLLERVKKEEIKEVILALKPSVEGETTSLYISKKLEDTDVKITKIAYGIPIGAEIDYVDSLTLEMAIENRLDITTNKNS